MKKNNIIYNKRIIFALELLFPRMMENMLNITWEIKKSRLARILFVVM